MMPSVMMPSVMIPRPVVFVSGWGADASIGSLLTDALKAACDLPLTVHHIAFPEDTARTVSGLDAEVDELAQALPDQSIVIAWSLGGMLAARVAVRYPHKIAALCTLASNVSFVARAQWPTGLEQSVFDQFLSGYQQNVSKTARRFSTLQAQGHRDRKQILDVLSEHSTLVGASQKNNARLLDILGAIDNRAIYHDIEQPLLAIFGEHDALVPIQCMAHMQRDYSGPLREFVSMGACGHVPHVSHVSLLVDKIARFIEQNHTRNRKDKYHKDKQRIAAAFSKAASQYDDYAALQYRIADKLVKWAPELLANSKTLLDLGCGTGYCLQYYARLLEAQVLETQLLEAQLRQEQHAGAQHAGTCQLMGLDLAEGMLQRARTKLSSMAAPVNWYQGDLEALPFAPASIHSVVSSLAVQWASDDDVWLAELARVLKPGGLALIASLGPATLHELSAAWQQAKPDYVHVNQFTDADDIMVLAQHHGFRLELFATEFHTLEYAHVKDLMNDLKAIGAHNVNQGGNPGLTGRHTLQKLYEAYDTRRMDSGALPATYEVYYWLFKKSE